MIVILNLFRNIRSLHCKSRWIGTTLPKLREEGALYFTFIHPHEQLATRRFPALGCFAYIFHEPTEGPNKLDRFFSISVTDSF